MEWALLLYDSHSVKDDDAWWHCSHMVVDMKIPKSSENKVQSSQENFFFFDDRHENKKRMAAKSSSAARANFVPPG